MMLIMIIMMITSKEGCLEQGPESYSHNIAGNVNQARDLNPMLIILEGLLLKKIKEKCLHIREMSLNSSDYI